ncbi:MAG: hypothetical protein KGL16_12735 [Acidobacteriota bacterium]|nr:hypothetical protein [Acidobacteriota bacterium]
MYRTYIFRRAGMLRALAAVAVAAVVAGCGGGGGATTPTVGANATPTPTPSGVGVGIDSLSGGNSAGRAAGRISHGSAGSVVRQRGQQITRSSAGSISRPRSGLSVASRQDRSAAQRAAAQRAAAQRAAAQKAAQKTKTTPAPPVLSTPRTVTVTVTVRARTPTPPKTTVRTVTNTKLKTVTRIVTKTVTPNVPAGAFLPSKHPVLAQQSFTVSGSNIACELAGGAVRCAILRRVWVAPLQPSGCKGAWGDTIALPRQGVAAFVCSNRTIPAAGMVIPIGYDDKLGDFTCQVRSFGIDCFSPARHGFLLSRTGYTFY